MVGFAAEKIAPHAWHYKFQYAIKKCWSMLGQESVSSPMECPGIIKMCLSLEYGLLPGNLHYKNPNPTADGLRDGSLQVRAVLEGCCWSKSHLTGRLHWRDAIQRYYLLLVFLNLKTTYLRYIIAMWPMWLHLPRPAHKICKWQQLCCSLINIKCKD